MATQKTAKWGWDKPQFPSNNLAAELDALFDQIDADVGTPADAFDYINVGADGPRDYHYEFGSPAGFSLSPGPKQNSNSYSRITLSNPTAASITATATLRYYEGSDSSGPVHFEFSESVTVPANDTMFWYVGDGSLLPEDTYFFEVTTTSPDLAATDTRLYFHNYYHRWELTNDGGIRFSVGRNSEPLRTAMYLNPENLNLSLPGGALFSDTDTGIQLDARPLAYSDKLVAQNTGADFTILELEAPETDGKEATLALMRHEPDGTPQFLDLFNNGYADSEEFGFRVQTRGGGTLKPFKIQFNDGSGTYDRMTIPPEGPVRVEGGLEVEGSTRNVQWTDASTYNATGNEVVISDATAGENLVILPVEENGLEVSVKKADSSANRVRVAPSYGVIDGQGSYYLNDHMESMTAVCDGTNWWVI
mgnify:CR=1 FL=1